MAGGIVGGIGTGFFGGDMGKVDGDDIVSIALKKAGFIIAGEDIIRRSHQGRLVLLRIAEGHERGDSSHGEHL
jgi:hypothetical protein